MTSSFCVPSFATIAPTIMKGTITCILMMCAYVSFAQVTLKEFKQPNVEEGPALFPLIQSAQNPEAAKKMNAVITKDWGFDGYAKDPWKNFAVVEEASFNYSLGANNPRAFSIEMQSSYAACGLHITRYDYSFDAKTGATIDLNKLFGSDGQQKLRKALAKTWKIALKGASLDPGESRSDEYKQCLADNENKTEANIERMLVQNDGVTFWIDGCLEGTAYDFEADRVHGPHFYSVGQLLPMLTPYGFSLFVDKGSGATQNLLRGTIDGKYPISLLLLPGENAGSITGTIIYDRVGIPMQVEGKMNGNQITFHEFERPNEYLSDIEVSWDGTKLTGSFTNLKTKKQMPFAATSIK